MKRMKSNQMKRWMYAMAVPAMIFGTTACSDDDDDNGGNGNGNGNGDEQKTYTYAFNNGELGAGSAYAGEHRANLTAEMMVESNGENADITITLNNTIDGEMYAVHAHDAADASTTPNGTPYDETPNGDVLVLMIEGNGGAASETHTTSGYSFSDVTEDYEGFFVCHDPTQQLSTVDISTYLTVGSFARDQGGAPNYESQSFSYPFNTGQLDPSFAYSGSHSSDLMATLTVQELANNESRVSVELTNTVSGETYPVHAHDAADPASTPNGTPYDETPNAGICTLMLEGNGATAYSSQVSSESYAELTSNYDGFFVVHDPLQTISTVDLTTYLVVGLFAE